MLRKITQWIGGFDLFAALPTLRMRGQPQVTNACGGLFSICLFGFFVYVFISNIISTIKLESITSKQTLQVNETYVTIKNLKMAVGLQSMNLSQLRNFFQLRVFITEAGKSFVPVSIQQCKREMWSEFEDGKYALLNLDYHMCINSDQIQIYGQNGAPDLKAVYFNLSVCSNSTSPVPCASPTAIDYFFSHFMIFNRYLACSLVILDVGFNPTNQIPIQYVAYQKTLWLVFNRDQYIMAQTFIGTYHISTDISFLPMSQHLESYGYYVVDTLVLGVYNLNSTSQLLVQSFIFATALNKFIERQYGKIDDVLSYVGGLFGLVFSFFSFFLLSFNQYKYQLRVSQGAFSTESSHLSKQSDFHFFKYLKYSLFDWIKTFTRCQPSWQDCIAIEQARQQANQQIDVKFILQRLSHIEMVMRSQNFNKEGDTAMYMVRHSPIQQAKQRRMLVEYCDKFVGETAGMTISALENIKAVFNFSNVFSMQVPETQNNSITELPKTTIQPQYLKEMSSFQLIRLYIQKYRQKLQQFCEDLQFSEQDIKAEQQLARSFYSLSEEKRLKMIKDVPIGILYRLIKLDDEQNNKYTGSQRKAASIQLNKLKRNKSKVSNQFSLMEYKQ